MRISPKYTQDIVESLNEIINQDINFMNEDSIIIASTDDQRIGKYHGGAAMVISTKEPLIIHYKDEYEGALPGINLPVTLDDEIIGVVGITGSEEEIGKYGLIIQRMTEILVKEAAFKTKEQSRMDAMRFLVEEIINGNFDAESMKSHASFLSVLPGKYAVVLISIMDSMINSDMDIFQKLYKSISRRFVEDGLLAHSGNKFIAVIHCDNKEKVRFKSENLIKHIEEKYDVKLSISLGRAYEDFGDLHHSFREAKRANRTIRHKTIASVVFYEDLDLEILLSEISPETKEKYIENIFSEMSPAKIEDFIEIITTYVQRNGSILEASKDLFIHKNTLQYRLNKIHLETGYNPRNLKELIILYLGIMIMNE